MVNEDSLETVMTRLFGESNWHKVVNGPGVWAYSRASGGWNEMIKQEETVVTDFDMRRFHADTMQEKMAEQAARTDEPAVNLAIGEEPATKVELSDSSELAAKVRYYDQLTEAINQAQADRLKVQDEIKAFMDKATTATLHGVPTFTFQSKATWRTADIAKAMPHLVDQYRVKREVEVVDWARFIEHHRDAVAEYQTREFRRVSGTRATGR